MALHEVVSNPGAGGARFAANVFADTDAVVRTLGYAQLAFGADGAAPTVVVLAAGLPVQPQTGSTWAVTGTFWQATQPISIADGSHVTFGAEADAAAGTDTATASYIGLFKRLLQRVTTLLGQLPAALTGAGNLKAAIVESTATVTVAGTVTSNQGGANWSVNVAQIAGVTPDMNTGNASANTPRVVLASNQPAVNVTETNLDGSIVAWAGTTAPTKGVGVLGKTNDGTAQYQPIPEGPGGRTVIIEGYVGGVAVPVSGTVTANQGGAPWSENITQFAGSAVVTGTGAGGAGVPRVTVSNDSNVLATQSGTWTVQQGGAPWSENITQIAGSAIATGHGTAAGTIRVELPTDGTGQVNAIQSGTWTVQPGNTANTTPWLVTQTPATSGGCSAYSVNSSGAANQDAAAVKGSAGQLYGYALFNTTASARFVKLYNKASGATSADTPVLRIYLPPTGGANMPVGDSGVAYGTGICIRITTGAADNDTGACSANDVLANVFYK